MHKLRLLLIAVFFVSTALSQNFVRLEIKSLPSYHAPNENIYLAGSFNNWNPADEQYKFKKANSGNYFLELKLPAAQYEYKITRGSWEKVECKKGGDNIANRILIIPSATTIQLSVEDWADHITKKVKTSTASKNVHIIDTAFWMPQLKRTRRI